MALLPFPLAPRILLAAALVVAFLAAWIVLPAPNRLLLALGVGAPELSAWLLVGALIAVGLIFAIHGPPEGGHYARRVTVMAAVVAAVLAAAPLVRIPSAVRRFDATMRTALGDDFMSGIPAVGLIRFGGRFS